MTGIAGIGLMVGQIYVGLDQRGGIIDRRERHLQDVARLERHEAMVAAVPGMN